jgi:hypothetical protein
MTRHTAAGAYTSLVLQVKATRILSESTSQKRQLGQPHKFAKLIYGTAHSLMCEYQNRSQEFTQISNVIYQVGLKQICRHHIANLNLLPSHKQYHTSYKEHHDLYGVSPHTRTHTHTGI